MAKNKKVVRYRRPFHFNIGLVIFGIIFFYVMFYVYSYFTSVRVSVYEVIPGSIAVDNSYTGLALRQEEIVTSDNTGAINYYIKDGSKAGTGDLVCSIDSDGSIAKQINAASQDASSLDEESMDGLQNKIFSYSDGYRPESFYEVYTFKSDLNAELSEVMSMEALSSVLDPVTAVQGNASFHTKTAGKAGIVVYYTDGYESVTAENLTPEMFDESAYKKNNLKEKTSISAGEAAFKLITNENWQLAVPIDSDTAKRLQDTSAIRIRFKKDGTTARASASVSQKDGSCFLILGLSNSMIRFATDRFVEIELLLQEESGLKIPNSAITTKEFYTVPMEYFQKGNNSGDEGVMVRKTDKNGNTEDSFAVQTVYFSTEYSYYVDGDKLSDGDVILKPNSKETYTIHDTASLKGVYCINKGYAVFRKIDTIYQNEEYSIIRSGTDYGISMYDHIALDGTAIAENALINE